MRKKLFRMLVIGICLPAVVGSLVIFLPVNNTSAVGFSDVPETHPFAAAIHYVQEKLIVNGYTDGTFKPDAQINRAEFTKIIIGTITHEQPPVPTRSCFRDVRKTAWYAPYVCMAKERNIISGFPNKTFKPSQNISFAEAAKIVVNSFEFTIETGEPWYQPYINVLEAKNALPSSLTDPAKLLTRGEMADIIYRILEPQATTDEEELKIFKQKIIDLTNVEREKENLAPLTYNALLENSAQKYAEDMLARDFFAHIDPDGKNPQDRITATGYLDPYFACECTKSSTVGENLGVGQHTAVEMIKGWMNSPEHRAAILKPEFTEIGVGVSKIDGRTKDNYTGYYWVQNFGNIKLEK